jgi:hypothetical protein
VLGLRVGGGVLYFHRNAANHARLRSLHVPVTAKLVKSLRHPPKSIEEFNWFPDALVEHVQSGTYFAIADAAAVARAGGSTDGRLDLPSILKLFTDSGRYPALHYSLTPKRGSYAPTYLLSGLTYKRAPGRDACSGTIEVKLASNLAESLVPQLGS